MKVYRHYRPVRVWLPLLLTTIVGLGVAAVGVAVVVRAVGDGFAGEALIPPALVALPVAGVGINLWFLARTAHEIRLEGPSIELIAPMRRVRIPIGEITKLAPWEAGCATWFLLRHQAGYASWFLLRHQSGGVVLDPRLDGMHDLIAEIKRQNPAVELRGC